MSNFHDNQHKRSLKTDLKKFSNSKDWDSSHLTLSWRGPLSYRNQSIDLQSKSVDWFLYYNGLCHERVKSNYSSKNWFITHFSVWYIKNYVEVIYVKSFRQLRKSVKKLSQWFVFKRDIFVEIQIIAKVISRFFAAA